MRFAFLNDEIRRHYATALPECFSPHGVPNSEDHHPKKISLKKSAMCLPLVTPNLSQALIWSLASIPTTLRALV